jgi:hypothetical protein
MKQQLWVILGSVIFILLGVVMLSISSQYRFEESLCWFDCVWYQSIINHGYSFHYNQQSNVAFFPLFPFVWKMLGLSFFSMSLFNLFYLLPYLCVCCAENPFEEYRHFLCFGNAHFFYGSLFRKFLFCRICFNVSWVL